jgi:hypothetical protein
MARRSQQQIGMMIYYKRAPTWLPGAWHVNISFTPFTWFLLPYRGCVDLCDDCQDAEGLNCDWLAFLCFRIDWSRR